MSSVTAEEVRFRWGGPVWFQARRTRCDGFVVRLSRSRHSQFGSESGLGSYSRVPGAEIVELHPSEAGVSLTLRIGSRKQLSRIALRELPDSGNASVIGDRGDVESPSETAAVILSDLTDAQLESVRWRVTHVHEVLTGHRSGHPEFAGTDGPRGGGATALMGPHPPALGVKRNVACTLATVRES